MKKNGSSCASRVMKMKIMKNNLITMKKMNNGSVENNGRRIELRRQMYESSRMKPLLRW